MQSNLNPEVEFEPESVPEVSVKPPRSHHRRRRGARKSEKNKKSALQNNNSSTLSSADQIENDLTNSMAAEAASESLEAAATVDDDETLTETLVEKQPEWEMVPKEIIADPDFGKMISSSYFTACAHRVQGANFFLH